MWFSGECGVVAGDSPVDYRDATDASKVYFTQLEGKSSVLPLWHN